jgi:fatty acid desaturase
MPDIFRYREDRIPTACIIALFIVDCVVYLYVDSLPLLLLWLLVVVTPKIGICSWNHHHQHLATFHQTWLNRCLEFIYTFHTGITTNAWVLHHVLGHHVNYLDQSKDESGWKRGDGTVMGEMEYTWNIAATGYPRAFMVGWRHKRYLGPFLGMGALSLVTLAVLFYYRWLNALTVFAIPMVFGYVVTCWHTYCHHAGLDTDDHFQASHNIMHRWYNIMTGNLGFHTAHHVKPGLHWSRLPEFHASIADKIPAHLYIEPCIPFKWFPAGDLFPAPKRGDAPPTELITAAGSSVVL